MTDLAQALVVTLVGMGLVFASLAVLMVIMMALERIFPARRRAAPVPGPAPIVDEPELVADGEEEVVAAIAVALAVLRERQHAAPPTTVLTLPDTGAAWRAAGRVS